MSASPSSFTDAAGPFSSSGEAADVSTSVAAVTAARRYSETLQQLEQWAVRSSPGGAADDLAAQESAVKAARHYAQAHERERAVVMTIGPAYKPAENMGELLGPHVHGPPVLAVVSAGTPSAAAVEANILEAVDVTAFKPI